MFKDVPFSIASDSALQFNVLERSLLRNIFHEYLSNKIFFQPVFAAKSESLHFRKLERNFNLRRCILYFYSNPLYNQPFDRSTLISLFLKLKRMEMHLLNFINEEELREYSNNEALLPVFMLFGEQETISTDLEIIYKGILDRESVSERSSVLFLHKLVHLIILFRFAIRIPFVHIIRALRFRKSVVSRFKHIAKIDRLWKTINVLSFQINFLVFGKGIRDIIKGKSEIADLSTFVMLIGDDFIDQIAIITGNEKIISLISQNKEAFGIKINDDYTLQSTDLVSLYRKLHLNNEKIRDDDSMTFDQLYLVMIEIFSEINLRLLKISFQKRKDACEAISSFLNYCLSTYLDDLVFSARMKVNKCTLQTTSWYFYKKNNFVMMYGLWLRARLMNLNYEKYLPKIREWGSLVENLQLYDDLKDMKGDWDFQPNYPNMISYSYFTDEHHWFGENRNNFSSGNTHEEIVALCISMPETVANTMLFSKYMGLNHLDWFTKFAANYCWKQNWMHAFLHLKGFTKMSGHDLSKHQLFAETRTIVTTTSKEVNLVFGLLVKTQSLFSEFVNKDFYFDYLLMLCLYDRNFSRNFYTRTNIVHNYYLIYRFQFMKTGHRTRLLNRFMKRKKTAIAMALNQINTHDYGETMRIPEELLDYVRKNWM